MVLDTSFTQLISPKKSLISEHVVKSTSFRNHFSSPLPKTLDIVYNEVFEELEYDIDLKNDTPLIFDCGAHIGVASVFFADKYPNSKILAFEPNPSSVVYYSQNAARYLESKQIELYQVALGSKKAIVQIHPTQEAGSLLASTHFNYPGPSVPVQCHTLSTYLNDHTKIDLIKVDVEGAEWDIIQDLIDSNSLNKIDNLIIEFHERTMDTGKIDAFVSLISSHGFKFEVRSQKTVPMFNCSVIHFFKVN